MNKINTLTHEFVEFIPKDLKSGIIYISIEYATAVHKCCCGCNSKVVTPISPTDWKLIFDGNSISLEPSIGNWSYPCRSHYWITGNEVRWSYQMSQEQINAGRSFDKYAKEGYYNHKAKAVVNTAPAANLRKKAEIKAKDGFLEKIKHWLFG